MSGCLVQSPYKMNNNNNIVNEELHSQNPLQKKGIVSVLSSEFSNSTTPKSSSSSSVKTSNNNNNNSIRRSMSADMSSPKWLENNGFSSMKRVQSSEQLKVLEEEDDQNNGEMNDNKGNSGGAAFEDIWSSILSEKKTESGNNPAPYVHPLMKRASSLSEKSLEICTESLGSETGSDGFSYPPSDPEEDQEPEQEQEGEVKNDWHVEEMKGYVEVVKYNYNYSANSKKTNIGAPRSFPPPLPSLAHRDDGSNLHMRTRRQDGRLVLEAVSVPSNNCFRARRQDGRLLLTLTNNDDDGQQEQDEDFGDDQALALEEEMNDHEAEQEVTEDVEKELALVAEPRTGMVNVHRPSPAMIMSKLMELTSTRNKSTWPRISNTTIIKTLDEEEAKRGEEKEEEYSPKKKLVEVETKRQKVAKCLPPRPRVSTAKAAEAALNAYEYYWRRSDSPTAAAVAVLKPLAGKQYNNRTTVSPQVVKDTNRMTNKYLLARNGKGAIVSQEEVVLVKAAAVVGGAAGEKGEYLVPMLRGCKEPRRPLLFWEPYCIATS